MRRCLWLRVCWSSLRSKVTCRFFVHTPTLWSLRDWLSLVRCMRECVSVLLFVARARARAWLSSYTSDCRRYGQQPDMAVVVVLILRTSLCARESNSQQNNKPWLRRVSHCSCLWSCRIASLSRRWLRYRFKPPRLAVDIHPQSCSNGAGEPKPWYINKQKPSLLFTAAGQQKGGKRPSSDVWLEKHPSLAVSGFEGKKMRWTAQKRQRWGNWKREEWRQKRRYLKWVEGWCWIVCDQ